MLKTRPLLFIFLMFVEGGHAFGASTLESEEEQKCLEISQVIHEKFDEPAECAQLKHDFKTALDLQEKANREWASYRWTSAWATQTTNSKIVANYGSMAQICRMQGQFKKASNYLMKAEDILHSGHFFGEAAYTLEEGKLFSNAQRLYEQMISQNKTDLIFEPHIGLSRSLAAQGNSDAAEGILKTHIAECAEKHKEYEVRAARIALKDLLLKQSKLSDAEKIGACLDDKHCPRCGSDTTVIPVAYGLPNHHSDQIHFAGCTHFPGSPQWWCKKDNAGF